MIGGLKMMVIYNLLVCEETEGFQGILVLVRIINSSDFPSFMREWPFIVFSDVNMIAFNYLSLKMHVKFVCLLSCFTDY